MYDDEKRQLDFTHHRIDGTIGDKFTLKEASSNSDSEDSESLGVVGIDSLLVIFALAGAAVRGRESVS